MASADSTEASIRQQITSLVQVEEGLLAQYRQLRSAPADVSGQLIVAGLSEGAKAFATDLFSSTLAGRYAKGLAKRCFRENARSNLAVQESNIDAQHQDVVRRALGLLLSVSEKKPHMTKPNSEALVARIERAQGFLRLDTRIKRTILALKDTSRRRLTYHGVSSLETVPLAPKPKLMVKFPRIASILTEVAALEPRLRKHIRDRMRKEYGDAWQGRIKEKFGSSYGKWDSVSRARGGRDVLDGAQFGDLVNILNQFDVLRVGILATKQAQLAVTIIQGERRILVHPLEAFEDDIDEERYKTTSMAILSLTSML